MAGSMLLFAMTWVASGQVTYKPIASDPIRVDGGLISGTYLKSGLKAYFGVPFAAPPIRENRWREPQPVQPWQGVLTANRMMPMCVQNLRSNNINHYFGDEAACEDCLYLNLWAPGNAKAGDKLPVVVWIYGGAFSGGSSSMALYGGQGLAKKGVVYVAFNYRVGIFGFLAHPDATRESGHNASGNWGFLDQVAALRWVNRNIAKFGGDPGNVMLIGQSAGSMSINYLQASPLAKGLFHKAFGMSGGTIKGPGSETGKLADAEAQGLKLQQAMKVNSLAEMRTFSSDKVTAAAQGAGVRASPIIDGYYLPAAYRRNLCRGPPARGPDRRGLDRQRYGDQHRGPPRHHGGGISCGRRENVRSQRRCLSGGLPGYYRRRCKSGRGTGRHRKRHGIGRQNLGPGPDCHRQGAGLPVPFQPHPAVCARSGICRSRSQDRGSVPYRRRALLVGHAGRLQHVPRNPELGRV